ncbi:phosphatase PAP2 family protein [Aliiruegeria lutimaris]|uniref:PAP2 superfamily protein n=1 Tax=Aliiruegeria lutimaris TaxID=571298 RepID=A0A1G8RR88_9RHOB|nr:phosphatase PAP2 family protein [Aliiruegeria lutimaris]SDJ18880.1 PAP2 superfamily protein [Aliiruegeria lutimaris]
MTAEALRHLGGDAVPPVPGELTPGDPSNYGRLAVWVRGSLYVSEYLSGIGWKSCNAGDDHTSVLQVDGADWVTLHRPSAELLRDQTRRVSDYAPLREERGAEILSQLGFPTAYFAMILGLHSASSKKTFELITATQVAAAHSAMIVKTALAVRRPDQVDGRILPMIPTPGHGSFPSAHATEAYAVLTVLEALVEAWGSHADRAGRVAMLRGLAERIAVNRTVAGVHYPIDSWAGATLGRAVGRAVLGRCGRIAEGGASVLDATDVDFFDHDLRDPAASAAAGLSVDTQALRSNPMPAFTWLWEQAAGESEGG